MPNVVHLFLSQFLFFLHLIIDDELRVLVENRILAASQRLKRFDHAFGIDIGRRHFAQSVSFSENGLYQYGISMVEEVLEIVEFRHAQQSTSIIDRVRRDKKENERRMIAEDMIE